MVTLQGPAPGAAIYYTLDGTLPTTHSAHYTGPFQVNFSAALMANAFETNYVNNVAVSGVFTIVPLNNFFAPVLLSNGGFQVKYWAPAGQTYVLQASSDLIVWVPIGTNTPSSAPFTWVDPGAGRVGRRYYCVVPRLD